MEKLHGSIETFRDVELKGGSNLTMGEWLDKWLDERIRFTVRESTLDGYRRIANNYIKSHLGDKKKGKLRTQEYLDGSPAPRVSGCGAAGCCVV